MTAQKQPKTPPLVRTAVPLIVGAVGAWVLNNTGYDLPDALTTEFLTVLLSALYFMVAHWLEEKFPELSVLLGSRQKPTYADSITGVPAYVGRHRATPEDAEQGESSESEDVYTPERL